MPRKFGIRDLFDPFHLAILLNVIVAVLGLFPESGGPDAVIKGWVTGFTGLFGFAMQMILMLALGHAFATSPLVLRILQWIAGWITDRRYPAFWVAVFTSGFAWLHWGLGLVAGGLIARTASSSRDDDRTASVRYAAAAYAGFISWHGGLSGSAPLVVATPSHFLVDITGVIPVSATIFSPLNLATLVFATLAVAIYVAVAKVPEVARPNPLADEPTLVETPEDGPAHGVWIGGGVLIVLVLAWIRGIQGFNLNFVILALFALALMVQQNIGRFQAGVREGLVGTVGIAIQFPLYGAIMGVMKSTGIAVFLSESIVNGVSAQLFPLAAFLSAGLLNVVVPSGGGQWAVQGPILAQAATAVGVPIEKMIIYFAWGDAWTNLIQPFWALPMLALTGVRAQDLLQVSWKILVVSGVVISAVFLIF